MGNVVTLVIGGDNGAGVSVTIACDKDGDPLALFDALDKLVAEAKERHLHKMGYSSFTVRAEPAVDVGEMLYNGYPVSYWHQQAVHYRQRMIEIARTADMAIDAEPPANGIERE